MIEDVIYSRLSGDATLSNLCVGGIYPTQCPEDATAQPVLVYTISGEEPVWELDGPADITKYNLDIEVAGVTLADVVAVLARSRHRLNGWRDTDNDVVGCFFQSSNTAQDDVDGYNGYASYAVARPGALAEALGSFNNDFNNDFDTVG
jgi:hypothetical protein